MTFPVVVLYHSFQYNIITSHIRSSARMTWTKQGELLEGEENAEQETLPEDEPAVELRCGRVISAHKLPLSSHREKLQEAIRAINHGKNPNSK